MAGNDGEVNGAALGDLADGAGPSALDNAPQQPNAGLIGQSAEERGIQRTIDGQTDARSLPRREARQIIAGDGLVGGGD